MGIGIGVTPDADTILLLRMDEAAVGDDLVDEMGGADIVVAGNPDVSTGLIDGARSFDGLTKYAIGSPDAVAAAFLLGEFSVEAQLVADELSEYATVLLFAGNDSSAAQGYRFGLYINADGTLEWFWANGGGDVFGDTTAAISVGVDTRLGFSCKDTGAGTREVKIFIDGVRVQTWTGQQVASDGGSGKWNVGIDSVYPTGGGGRITISELVVSKRLLTESEFESRSDDAFFGGTPLAAPTSLSVTTEELVTPPPLSLGGATDDHEAVLRKHLNPALKGSNWDALLAGLATGDRYVSELAASAFDQLFKSSAGGIYLDRRAADDGFTRPSSIGIPDEIFRTLAIKTTARKLVIEVILEALEAYYGSEATRANTTSTVAAPYALQDDDTLVLQVDGGDDIVIEFERDDFARMGVASALEVAAAITRKLRAAGSDAYAIAFSDPSLGEDFIRIFSGALGLRGSIRVTGGRTQNLFLFPSLIFPDDSTGPQVGTQWTIEQGLGSTNGIDAGRVRFTWSGGGDPSLQEVWVGDYVTIYGTTFSEDNRGTFTVVDVTPAYFEIENDDVVDETVEQLTQDDLRIYRPTKRTIQSTGRMATATQGDPTVLDVTLPATTQAVGREEGSGAYLHDATALTVSSGSRAAGVVTLVTSTAHGLAVGDWVNIDDLVPSNAVTTTTGFVAGDAGHVAVAVEGMAAVVLADGRAMYIGGGPAARTSCFLYDPDADAWSVAASLSTARYGHAAVVLDSGRVLVAGGFTAPGVATASCELYDPDTNTWSGTGSMVKTRFAHQGCLLDDGRAFIAGGAFDGTKIPETYNPVTGTWTVAAAMSNVHYSYSSMVKLYDGRVAVIGGSYGLDTEITYYWEIYNPINDSWVKVVAPHRSADQQATLLPIGPSGKILVSGGKTAIAIYDEVYLWDPMSLVVTQIGSLSEVKSYHTHALLPDGRLLIAGGITTGPVNTDTSDIYDPILGTIEAGPALTVPASNMKAVSLDNGKVLFTGLSGAYSQMYLSYVDVLAAGGLNGLFQVTVVPSSTSFRYATPDFLSATTLLAGGTVVPTASTTNGVAGPFVYDTTGLDPSITGTKTELDAQINGDSNYNSITVVDASDFPDAEGWLCFGFGTKLQASPVKYLGKQSSTLLLLDPSYTFEETLPVGTAVILLTQRGSYVPEDPEEVGTFYLTASSAGRVEASRTVDQLVGAGLNINKTIIYPGDKGLGNEGQPSEGVSKLSDKVEVWGGDDLEAELDTAREES